MEVTQCHTQKQLPTGAFPEQFVFINRLMALSQPLPAVFIHAANLLEEVEHSIDKAAQQREPMK